MTAPVLKREIRFTKVFTSGVSIWHEAVQETHAHEACDYAAQRVDDGDADEATLDGETYTREGGWEGLGDCVSCDGYVLDPLEKPHCPTCARLLREGKPLT